MKKNLLLIFLIINLLFLSNFVFAAPVISLPNPLCASGSQGTCNIRCDDTAWQYGPNSSGGTGYSSFAACCTDGGFSITGGTGTCIQDFPALIAQITNYISLVIGSLAILMFVISGIMFITSAGSPEKIRRAKDIAVYALIGAAIALSGAGLVVVVREVIGA
ncbi:MAG: hypothetical protein UR46_C0034G0014 [Parcubacteria group bacterium GW2011_GWA1_33_6]|uniref:Uncharacterized protein n=1 Tax=Candidatus Staskawiczbacteria bacterium RIFCSPHIGHO2_02_FULL_33_16 TaxID=1802204 RepID=A0A1G2HXF1_9BACT|nr:MAG: hypothetical protein UR31_C0021G0004 [Parcubacteria group bacterium GW2011_GWA2_33_14]KKP53446.1 MAG: hypothetical protein UR46_C0034G0014 [Parcubacteria group bacterium GW2011_GWA1_33_6]OGZ67224.1 MAG: hypothetical protein A3D34_00355 [Candidatus Staskawiczbacteria bacterium RIFCSPHIGHO2_02_FULL_33_16]OGZ70927.1 MAG: hypothetical protein A2980_02825 [Candidatus Staskawiczbacteria bacterium RIFCSPLOWO2_01_FULL_33_13]